MSRLRRTTVLRLSLAVLLAVLAGSCTSDPDPSGIQAYFEPATRTPGPNQVFLSMDYATDQRIAVSVRIRETSGIYGADLSLRYDPARVLFLNWDPGFLFESAGVAVHYDVFESEPGVLRIQVYGQPPDPHEVDADATGPRLVTLGLQVNQPGTAAVVFGGDSVLVDAGAGALPDVEFYGGVLVGLAPGTSPGDTF